VSGGSPPDFQADGNRMATVTPMTAKNARKNERSLVEARRLELDQRRKRNRSR
jgi:hypothetical protein